MAANRPHERERLHHAVAEQRRPLARPAGLAPDVRWATGVSRYQFTGPGCFPVRLGLRFWLGAGCGWVQVGANRPDERERLHHAVAEQRRPLTRLAQSSRVRSTNRAGAHRPDERERSDSGSGVVQVLVWFRLRLGSGGSKPARRARASASRRRRTAPSTGSP
ncbi:hypothetical protein T484DRAFT_1749776, partial [Baffinella frigidus]